MRTARREKVFGPGRAVPLDGNAKARIPGLRARLERPQPPRPPATKGPVTRAFLDVLEALLWGFHNAAHGLLLPKLRGDRRAGGVRPQHGGRGAEGAGAGRRAVLAAPVDPDPRGAAPTCSAAMGWRWRVIRTSNAYVFSDPKAAVSGGFASKSENPTGNTGSRNSNLWIEHRHRLRQPAGAGLATVRCRDRRKVAREGEWWDRLSV